MKIFSAPFSIALALSLPLLFSACVDREETIRIRPDRSFSISVAFTADQPEELYPGRTPRGLAGWTAALSTKTDSEGKVKHIARFDSGFLPGAAIPDSYEPEDVAGEGVFLRFPTEIRWEEGDGGAICHFSRKYEPRAFAWIQSLKIQAGGDRLAQLQEKDPGRLSAPDRLELLQGLVRFEILKKLSFARQAFLAVTPEASQLAWLKVRDSAMALADTFPYTEWADRLAPESHRDEAALAAEAERFERLVKERIVSALKEDCGYGEPRLADFLNRFEREERRFRVTEELTGECFEIVVEMPGEILGTNADRIEGNKAIWEFPGSILHDAGLELLVSSRVAQ